MCKNCNTPVIRGVFSIENIYGQDDDDEEDEENLITIVCHKCSCLKNWYDEKDLDEDIDQAQEEFANANSTRCKNETVPQYYFDVSAKYFIAFLEQHLKYCQENPDCFCYWPYRSKTASEISDTVYNKVDKLLARPYLQLRDIGQIKPMGAPGEIWMKFFDNEQKKYLSSEEYSLESTNPQNRTIHGILFDLFTHAFFYSHYKQILLQLAQWEESQEPDILKVEASLESIANLLSELGSKFLDLYSQCLDKHPHPKIYYERGMLLFQQGEIFNSLEDIETLIDWAHQHHHDELLNSDLFLQECVGYSELGLYDQAVRALNDSIRKDPTHRDAYFERASAYFELGEFDFSLQDYLASGFRPRPVPENSTNLLSFSFGLTKGILRGSYGVYPIFTIVSHGPGSWTMGICQRSGKCFNRFCTRLSSVHNFHKKSYLPRNSNQASA